MLIQTHFPTTTTTQTHQSALRLRVHLPAARATLAGRLSAHPAAAVRRAHQSRLPRDAGGARARLPGRLLGQLDAGRQAAGPPRGGQCGLPQRRSRPVPAVHPVGRAGEHRAVCVHAAEPGGHVADDGFRERGCDRPVCAGGQTGGAAAAGLQQSHVVVSGDCQWVLLPMNIIQHENGHTHIYVFVILTIKKSIKKLVRAFRFLGLNKLCIKANYLHNTQV